MFFALILVPHLPVALSRVDHLVSGVLMDVVVGRVYGWPIEPHFLRDLSNVCYRPFWWWCCWLIHPFMPMWLWFTLLRGLPLQDGLFTVVYPPVGVKNWCGKLRLYVSQYLLWSRLFPKFIATSLTVLYSAGVGAMEKGDHRKRNYDFSNIALHVYMVLIFAYFWQ